MEFPNFWKMGKNKSLNNKIFHILIMFIYISYYSLPDIFIMSDMLQLPFYLLSIAS